MNHIDLFSGIGGFALAAQTVWGKEYNNLLFCDYDKFCQNTIRKNFPGSLIFSDINELLCQLKEGMTISAQSAGQVKEPKDAPIVNHVIQKEPMNGESIIGKSDTQGMLFGQEKENMKLLIDTEGNVSAVENQKKPSLPLTIKMEEAILKEKPINRKHGNLSSKTDTRTTTKSSAATAIMQNIITKYVHTKKIDLLTAGFPCQPFSQAGKREGTNDSRYLWPQTIEAIRLFSPRWIIGENVGGFVTWSDGLVLRQVFTDLESEGYEVQAFIIPAVSVNAPHRRDRVWIVASKSTSNIVTNTEIKRSEQSGDSWSRRSGLQNSSWDQNWIEVATELCRMDDGLQERLVVLPDGSKISYAKWRQEALKAYGNAIVPQVAIKIMEGIKEIDNPEQEASRKGEE